MVRVMLLTPYGMLAGPHRRQGFSFEYRRAAPQLNALLNNTAGGYPPDNDNG